VLKHFLCPMCRANSTARDRTPTRLRADARGRDGRLRQELAAGVTSTSSKPELDVKPDCDRWRVLSFGSPSGWRDPMTFRIGRREFITLLGGGTPRTRSPARWRPMLQPFDASKSLTAPAVCYRAPKVSHPCRSPLSICCTVITHDVLGCCPRLEGNAHEATQFHRRSWWAADPLCGDRAECSDWTTADSS
jgi:hypothetical protein